jgi:Tfp pilus assembly protein PilW
MQSSEIQRTAERRRLAYSTLVRDLGELGFFGTIFTNIDATDPDRNRQAAEILINRGPKGLLEWEASL